MTSSLSKVTFLPEEDALFSLALQVRVKEEPAWSPASPRKRVLGPVQGSRWQAEADPVKVQLLSRGGHLQEKRKAEKEGLAEVKRRNASEGPVRPRPAESRVRPGEKTSLRPVSLSLSSSSLLFSSYPSLPSPFLLPPFFLPFPLLLPLPPSLLSPSSSPPSPFILLPPPSFLLSPLSLSCSLAVTGPPLTIFPLQVCSRGIGCNPRRCFASAASAGHPPGGIGAAA